MGSTFLTRLCLLGVVLAAGLVIALGVRMEQRKVIQVHTVAHCWLPPRVAFVPCQDHIQAAEDI